MLKPRFDKVGVAGDWHGNKEWAVAALNEFARNGISVVLHLGDFGIGFKYGDDYIAAVNATLVKNGQVLYVTLGNHEDYVRVNAAPVREDGWIEYASNVLLAQRGQRWTWEGRSFVSLGGANSIDRNGRIEGISWWAEEQISMGDVYHTIEGGYADVFLAHDVPAGVPIPLNHRSNWAPEALKYSNQSKDMVRAAADGVRPAIYFHGHYHIYYDKTVTLGDFATNDVYKTRYIGLDQDTHDNNIGILRVADLNFEVLPFPNF